MDIKERLEGLIKRDTLKDEEDGLMEWVFDIAGQNKLEELHNALLDMDLEETSDSFLIGMMMLLNFTTSEMEVGIFCSVSKDTSTRWIRNDFAVRAYPIVESRDLGSVILHTFSKD